MPTTLLAQALEAPQVGNIPEIWDARTVEILSRTEAPPLRKKDIWVLHTGGRYYIVVRRYILMHVTPQDARSEGLSEAQLAQYWAKSVRRALPQIAPTPDRFGI
ncbi:MAG: hypothetical protein M1330_01740 [Armatimonadetes bacterium]|nr:hypothetical protein [Armatimonadota bacterium]